MLMKGQIHPLRGDYLANESGEWGSCLPRGKGGGSLMVGYAGRNSDC